MNPSRLILIFAILVFAPVGLCDYQIVWSTIDGGKDLFERIKI